MESSGPQGDPWKDILPIGSPGYWAWLANETRRVKVDGHFCFGCAHGVCPGIQAQAPVKALGAVWTSGQYNPDATHTVFYSDVIPLCNICTELATRDPSFYEWLRAEYQNAKEKGVA